MGKNDIFIIYFIKKNWLIFFKEFIFIKLLIKLINNNILTMDFLNDKVVNDVILKIKLLENLVESKSISKNKEKNKDLINQLLINLLNTLKYVKNEKYKITMDKLKYLTIIVNIVNDEVYNEITKKIDENIQLYTDYLHEIIHNHTIMVDNLSRNITINKEILKIDIKN